MYLSMIRDLYDNGIVAYKTGTAQSMNLVLDTIRQAVHREKKKTAAELHLHSDQGLQNTMPHTHISSILVITAIPLPCQDVGTRMTTQWRKISSRF